MPQLSPATRVLALSLGLLALGFARPVMAQEWAGQTALTLELQDDRGKPVEGARIELRFVDVEPMTGPPPVYSNAKGEAQLIRLAEGRWRMDVRRDGFSPMLVVLRLQAGKKPEITAGPIRDAVAPPMKVKFLKSPKAGETPTAIQPGTVVQRAPLPEPEPAPQPVPEQLRSAPPADDAPAQIPPAQAAPPPDTPAPAVPETPTAPRPAAPAPPPMAPPAATPPVTTPEPPPAPPVTTPQPAQPKPEPQPPTSEPAVVEPPSLAEEMPSTEPQTMPEAPEPATAAPETMPPAPATPAIVQSPPPAARNQRGELRAFTDPSCPGCKNGEWAFTLERQAAVATGRDRCPADASAVAAALERMAADAGPAPSGAPVALFSHAAALPAELDSVTAAGSSCQVLAVLLPKDLRYTGYRYEVRDRNDGGGCQAGDECTLGQCRWSGHPALKKTTAGTLVYGVFDNDSTTEPRTALFIVYFEPPKGWGGPR
ncbi:MAG: hypothetical protein KDD11_10930 [Acidobacteria bacterium]|nr:hypothetical protein [Acidobacteriota bacterium]